MCQSGIKKPNRGGFELCHGGQSYFQLSVRGIGFLAGQRIVLPYKCTDYIGPQSPQGLSGFFHVDAPVREM